MKSAFLVLASILLFNKCRSKEEFVYETEKTLSKGPEKLLDEHGGLLSKGKMLIESGDSIGKKLYEVMEYHFKEEELYVFPVLAVLPQLASGVLPEDPEMVINLAERYRSNASKLLAEHQLIDAYLREVEKQKSSRIPDLADFEKELISHGKAEEELFFPMVVVIGDYVKLKSTSSPK